MLTTLISMGNELRKPLPPLHVDRSQPQGGHVDALTAIDDGVFYAQGWLRDAEARITRLTAVSPEGERIELLERLFRYQRPGGLEQVYADGPHENPVDEYWFVVYFETNAPSRLRSEWIFEVENEAGSAGELHVQTAVQDPVAGRKAVLGSVPEACLADNQLLSDHLFPAASRLQERVKGLVKVAGSVEFGRPNESPEVSVVIPLCRGIDLVEHQLAQFVHDNELRSAELIYVLDSPELERALREIAEPLFGLYLVPFRILTMELPSGFAGAINSGAADARGRLLLLLNPETFPDKPGWLGKMRDFYDASSNIGALGPKLLYEDGSIQHAGLYLELEDEELALGLGALTNRPFFKGLSRDLPAANIRRPVPAVSAACLMVDRNLFERVGGLPDAYMQDDYEGADLCLRLQEEGRDNWYLPEVELYHLEAQSYGGTERGIAASYDRWLYTRRWGKLVEVVGNDAPVATGSR